MDFGIRGEGGLKFHSQRPRNPLTSLAGNMVKPEGEVLVYGLVIQVWTVAKPERLVSV